MSRWAPLLVFLLLSLHSVSVLSQFSITATNSAAGFNGRFGAGLALIPYPLTYKTWSYVINTTYTTAQPISSGLFDVNGNPLPGVTAASLTATAPANSLYLFGGQCGHNANALSTLGDTDVWTSPDGGVTWSLFGGAHGFSGSAQIYVQALSANTPLWQGSNPATYLTSTGLQPNAPQSYAIYPGSVAVHDNIKQKFYLLGGDDYYGSGIWRPTTTIQQSGGAFPINSSTGVSLTSEGQGWTNLCLDTVGGLSYSNCDSFTIRSSAASAVDSKGNLYVLNGIAQYDSNTFPYLLLGDVWMSTNAGLVWQQQSASTPWSTTNGRFESASVAVYSSYYGTDILYSIAGCSATSTGYNTAGATLTETGYNDVYASVSQGVTWYTVTATAAFSPRCGLSLTASAAGVLVVVGGRTAQSYLSTAAGFPTYYTTTLGLTTLTDIWTSMDGGVTWYQISTTGGRDRAAIALDSTGVLHIVGGKAGLGQGYSTTACPNDAYKSSQSFTSMSWITSVVPSATVPSTYGLRVAAVNMTIPAVNPFKMTPLNGGAGFAGRAGAGLAVLPNSITFQNWSYVINATYTTPNLAATNPPGLFNPATGAATSSRPLTITTPANSLFLFGGYCGHSVNQLLAEGDPDVWASTDGGFSWNLVGGAHGLDLGDSIGTYGQYVSALAAGTPIWQGSSPAAYNYTFNSQSYTTYPGSIPIHDNVNHKFYLLAGEAYAGSGHWNPTAVVQSSGAPTASLQQVATSTSVPLNAEGVGWTAQCLSSTTAATYAACGTFPARSSAGGTVDSKGNLYVMNGISAYDWTNVVPQTLLNDVYMSTNQGVSWTQQTTAVPWAGATNGRMESAAVSYYSSYYSADIIYNIGGCTVASTGFGTSGSTLTETGFNDVYASTNQGVTWYNLTKTAAWSARCGMSAAAASSGALVVVGGRKPQSYVGPTSFPGYYEAVLGYYTLTDIWTSLDGGYTWYQLSALGGRDRPALAFDASSLLHMVSGRVTAGVAYLNPTACPSDSYVSTTAFTAAALPTWIRTVPGLSAAVIPSTLGLTSLNGAGGGAAPISPVTCNGAFCLVQQANSSGWNGRFGAALVQLPNALSYLTWSYVINATYTSANLAATNLGSTASLTATAPANSLYLFGGQCGHNANPGTPLGDTDVWTSPDGGITWNLFGGAHGFSGAYQIYVAALSANTPNWQGSNPSNYPSTTAPSTYGIYPGSVPLHDNVNHRFYQLGGDYYYGSGIWRPTAMVQESGGTPAYTSPSGTVLNAEGLGWTNLCLDLVGGVSYSYCDSFTVRTSAAGATDSKGNVYIMNGIAEYDSQVFPYLLLGDVWMSTNGGLVWTQQAASTPWSNLGRMESAATSYFSSYYSADVIYSIGGCSATASAWNTPGATLTETGYSDVYASVSQGASWYTVTSSAAFSPRCGLQVVSSSAGVLVVVGGRSAQSYLSTAAGFPTYYTTTLGLTTLTDIWTSMDGGVTWYQVSTFGGRDRAAVLLDVNGLLHIAGGKTGLGQGYSSACPSDSYVSSQSFNASVGLWINKVVSTATVPGSLGLRVAAVTSTVPATNPFSMTAINGGAGFAGRAGAGLAVLPNSITFQNWSYVINATYTSANISATNPPGLFNPATGAATSSRPLTITTPANSLFLFGGECGHGVNPQASEGDPDVWASTDGGYSWNLVGGAHGLDFGLANVGTYGQYVSALAAGTPFWQPSSPGTYAAQSGPQSYATYPGSIPLHDNVNHKFYLVSGEAYAGSGHWNPSSAVQSSGAPTTSLQQLSSVNQAAINPEGVGWTNQCLNSASSASYVTCGSFPARSSAGGAVDSRGNLFVMNGISSYNWTEVFPATLLNDIWMSSNQGVSWTAQSMNPPWPVRMESSTVTYRSTYYAADVLYNIGGCSVAQVFTGANPTLVETGYNDVFASTNMGVTWYNITTMAPWSARCGVTVASTSSGVLALVGGRKPQSYLGPSGFPAYFEGVLGYYTLTDIWTSLDGGYTWYQLSATGGRDRPALAFDANSYLHAVSGRVTSGVFYLTTNACPSDSLISTTAFTAAALSTWLKTVPGLSTAVVPTVLGLVKGPPGGGYTAAAPTAATAATGGGGGTTGSGGGGNTNPTNGGGSSSSSLSSGAIAGIVIGSVVGALILVAVLAFFFCLNGRGGERKRKNSQPGNDGRFQEVNEESRVTGGEEGHENDGVEMTGA